MWPRVKCCKDLLNYSTVVLEHTDFSASVWVYEAARRWCTTAIHLLCHLLTIYVGLALARPIILIFIFATGKTVQSPLKSVDILDAHTAVLMSQFHSSSSELSFKGNHCVTVVWYCCYYTPFHTELLPMFEWLFCFLWRESYEKFNSELKSGKVMCVEGVHGIFGLAANAFNRMTFKLKKIVWYFILIPWQWSI